MSILFTPIRIGGLELVNRFVQSATFEAMGQTSGEVTGHLIQRYRALAEGQVGLIISSHLYVHPWGRTHPYQVGIHRDEMIPGLSRLAEAVHQMGGKILLQLSHAGRQTSRDVIGRSPLGASSAGRDPVKLVRPTPMREEEIKEAIRAFGQAARRAREAGADGVQLHAAHGYLLNQFLSPFFNRRQDHWGGTAENRFRFLKEVFLEIKGTLSPGMPLLVKINAHDHTPGPGVTPPLAAQYAHWLADLGVDGIEVSCGTIFYSFMNTCRGQVPVKELVGTLPWWERPFGWMKLKRMVGRYDLREGYNLETARLIKPAIGRVPLLLVGGLRRKAHMEEILNQGWADLISMSRPFIRQPHIVRQFQAGAAEAVSCVSCNRCFAALLHHLPVRCYFSGLPSQKTLPHEDPRIDSHRMLPLP